MISDPNPVLENLGYSADARLVIFHADDVGICRGSNEAYLTLHGAGIVQTGSVMIPCPWAAEILQIAAGRPELDLGVHLTLTCEYSQYRWGPVASLGEDNGLVMDDGRFWHTLAQLDSHLNEEAAIREMREQISGAEKAGLKFTHIDTHMGASLLPQLICHYLKLGIENQVPLLITRKRLKEINQLDWLLQLDSLGLPIVDDFRITPLYSNNPPSSPSAEVYEAVLQALPAGITYFSLHPNAPGDIEHVSPESADWRIFEYEYFQSERLRKFLISEEIVSIGYREICSALETTKQ